MTLLDTIALPNLISVRVPHDIKHSSISILMGGFTLQCDSYYLTYYFEYSVSGICGSRQIRQLRTHTSKNRFQHPLVRDLRDPTALLEGDVACTMSISCCILLPRYFHIIQRYPLEKGPLFWQKKTTGYKQNFCFFWKKIGSRTKCCAKVFSNVGSLSFKSTGLQHGNVFGMLAPWHQEVAGLIPVDANHGQLVLV